MHRWQDEGTDHSVLRDVGCQETSLSSKWVGVTKLEHQQGVWSCGVARSCEVLEIPEFAKFLALWSFWSCDVGSVFSSHFCSLPNKAGYVGLQFHSVQQHCIAAIHVTFTWLSPVAHGRSCGHYETWKNTPTNLQPTVFKTDFPN